MKKQKDFYSTFAIRILPLAFLFIFLQDANAQSRRDRKKQLAIVIATAKSYKGTPYQFGGMTKKGIDCSGLIYNSYKAAGIKVPRTAKEQTKIGKSKGWEDLREGDLVLFKFKEKGEKWWHSGMITELKGENIKFIHASSSKGVIESDLMSDYYKSNVKRFQRIIK
jgi:probable lipoprotein NlpC